MKILSILTLLFTILLMVSALSESVKNPQKKLKKGVWFGMFPLSLMVTIFCTINLLLPYPQQQMVDGQNVSILLFLFSCLMFGIATKFKSGSGITWTKQQP